LDAIEGFLHASPAFRGSQAGRLTRLGNIARLPSRAPIDNGSDISKGRGSIGALVSEERGNTLAAGSRVSAGHTQTRPEAIVDGLSLGLADERGRIFNVGVRVSEENASAGGERSPTEHLPQATVGKEIGSKGLGGGLSRQLNLSVGHVGHEAASGRGDGINHDCPAVIGDGLVDGAGDLTVHAPGDDLGNVDDGSLFKVAFEVHGVSIDDRRGTSLAGILVVAGVNAGLEKVSNLTDVPCAKEGVELLVVHGLGGWTSEHATNVLGNVGSAVLGSKNGSVIDNRTVEPEFLANAQGEGGLAAGRLPSKLHYVFQRGGDIPTSEAVRDLR
jgi:hypothetical protein